MEFVKSATDLKIYKMSSGVHFLDVCPEYAFCKIHIPDHVLKKAIEVGLRVVERRDVEPVTTVLATAIKEFCIEVVDYFQGYRKGVFVYNGKYIMVKLTPCSLS